MSTSTPTPAATTSSVLGKVQHEVVVVGGVVLAVGEGLATTLPAGPVHTIVVAALPIAVAVVTRAKTMSLAQVNVLINAIKGATKSDAPAAPAGK